FRVANIIAEKIKLVPQVHILIYLKSVQDVHHGTYLTPYALSVPFQTGTAGSLKKRVRHKSEFSVRRSKDYLKILSRIIRETNTGINISRRHEPGDPVLVRGIRSFTIIKTRS